MTLLDLKTFFFLLFSFLRNNMVLVTVAARNEKTAENEIEKTKINDWKLNDSKNSRIFWLFLSRLLWRADIVNKQPPESVCKNFTKFTGKHWHCSLFSNKVPIVCTPPPNKFSKKWGLDRTSTFRGGLLGKRGWYFSGGRLHFSHKK